MARKILRPVHAIAFQPIEGLAGIGVDAHQRNDVGTLAACHQRGGEIRDPERRATGAHLQRGDAGTLADFDGEVAAGRRSILLVSPTGSGKTVIGAEIIRRACGDVLVLAHRREIVSQTHRKLFDNGVRAGIIQAGIDPRPLERVQVASIQTL